MAVTAESAQSFVPIQEIRNGVVILKDGSMRAVLLGSSLNFALKSEDEQNAIILQFQNFLNSLDFQVQFFIQSRKLDIRPYIALLEERYAEQTIDLIKVQTREYIDFIKGFTESVSIMEKKFFIVIPYTPPVMGERGTGLGGAIGRVIPIGAKKEDSEKRLSSFEENRTQLEQRTSVVEQGLSRAGVRTVPLGTEELVELYYKIFNPGELQKPIKLG